MRARTILVALALLALPVVALADGVGTVPSVDANVSRLLDAKSTLKWNFDGADGRYGHAETLVAAPADKVATMAADFAHYKELHRKFQTARVIGKEADQTDVYMRYPVRIGPVTFELYEVIRFKPLRDEGGARVLEGIGIKGDMTRGRTVVTVKPVSATHSLLQIDVLLKPKVPAPQFMIDEELRDGAHDFVDGLRHRAQGWVGPVTQL